MEIRILECLKSLNEARGLIVVIDVFRAFTTACYLHNRGIGKYIALNSLDEAYQLKSANPSYVLMGERDGFKQTGFDFGNSPIEILHANCFDKTVIHTSSAGTKGLIEALKVSDQVITGSFVNATAIVHFIKRIQPEFVTLLAMGVSGEESSIEDSLCAEYISKLLKNEVVCNKTFEIPIYHKYQTLTDEYVSEGRWKAGDLELCMNFNYFSFVLKAIPLTKSSCTLEKIPLFG